ncbi:hypothetical protein T459_07480 [Capsicum annuum]|uniref:F-box domain-containing protein n=1 Tax=Capsicum annuum TaxID=4072 RepID=A0A2G2ZTS1_CAPAN|nr:hypothetical protein T459_07480 [Capsicum annuum]
MKQRKCDNKIKGKGYSPLSEQQDGIQKLKQELSKSFSMKDLGLAKQILGMQIFCDKKAKKLWLSQEKYIQKVLRRFNMDKAKVVSTPLAMHFKLSTKQCPSSDNEKEDMKKVSYASAVGSLMYAMVCTRSDIAHVVGVVSHFFSNPGREHWNVVKWIMRYLCGTSSMSLCFGIGKPSLCDYTDSDMAGDVDTRKSTSRYLVTFAGGDVSWQSRLQKYVALSTIEAELIAAVEACKELLWMKRFMGKLGCAQERFVDGKLYWVNSNSSARNIIYIDLVDEKWEKMELPSFGEGDNDLQLGVFGSDLSVLIDNKRKHLYLFMSDSKAWLALFSSPEFIDTHFIVSANNTEFLVLGALEILVVSGLFSWFFINGNVTEAFDLDYPMKIPHKSVWIVGSVNGLICLAIEENDLFIWNPSIRKFKKLPDSRPMLRCGYYFMYGFGYDKVYDDYKEAPSCIEKKEEKENNRAYLSNVSRHPRKVISVVVDWDREKKLVLTALTKMELQMESVGDEASHQHSKRHQPTIQTSDSIFTLPILPPELITEILVRLPVKSLLKFKSVSKSWLALILSPDFIKNHLNLSANNKDNTYHRIILSNSHPPRDPKVCPLRSLLDGDFVTEAYDFDYPMKNTTSCFWTVGSVNGLICLEVVDIGLCIWNPTIRKYKTLADHGTELNDDDTCSYGFGYDEVHDDYKSGDLESDLAKSVDGKIHWMTSEGEIIFMDLVDEKWATLNHPCYGEDLRLKIGVFGSDLSIFTSSAELWVLKEYGVEESWENILTIKTHDIYDIRPLFIKSNKGPEQDNLTSGLGHYKWCPPCRCGPEFKLSLGKYLVQVGAVKMTIEVMAMKQHGNLSLSDGEIRAANLISSPKFIKSHLEVSANNMDNTHHRLMLKYRNDNNFKDWSLSSLLYEPDKAEASVKVVAF